MAFAMAFILLFVVATGVAVLARRLRIPYTVALVVAGVVLGSLHALEPPHLTKELLFTLILPGLVFEAAFHLDFSKFWKDKLTIHSLAIPGVVLAILLTAVILAPVANALEFVQGFELIHALVFASVIVATDPIAVIALFKSLGAPKRLSVLVEGESLLNDGTGVVLFTLILGVALGGELSLSSAVVEFLKVAGVGAAIGAGIGYAVSKIIQRLDDAMVELTLTMVAGYGSFVAAEHFHFSGVIAAVAAGMFCGNYAARTGMSATTRIAVETFWEYVAFALNSVVFLLIGFEVSLGSLLASWKPIVVAYVVVMACRAIVVYAVHGALRLTPVKVPFSWNLVLTWAGLRGALSMVLALSLPQAFPHRELLVNMTYGVVVLSILIQGLTMPLLLRRLGLGRQHSEHERVYELERGRRRAAAAAPRRDRVAEGRGRRSTGHPRRARPRVSDAATASRWRHQAAPGDRARAARRGARGHSTDAAGRREGRDPPVLPQRDHRAGSVRDPGRRAERAAPGGRGASRVGAVSATSRGRRRRSTARSGSPSSSRRR